MKFPRLFLKFPWASAPVVASTPSPTTAPASLPVGNIARSILDDLQPISRIFWDYDEYPERLTNRDRGYSLTWENLWGTIDSPKSPPKVNIRHVRTLQFNTTETTLLIAAIKQRLDIIQQQTQMAIVEEDNKRLQTYFPDYYK